MLTNDPTKSLGPPDHLCPKCGEYVMASAADEQQWAALRAELDELKGPAFELGAHFDNAMAENEALRARVAELEADAARYRWLRDDASSGQWSYLEGCAGGGLDEAIDAWRGVPSAGTTP